MVTCVREHEAVRSEPMRVRIDDTTFENIESLERAIGLLDGLASLLAATLVTVHREVRTSRRVRLVYDIMAEMLDKT